MKNFFRRLFGSLSLRRPRQREDVLAVGDLGALLRGDLPFAGPFSVKGGYVLDNAGRFRGFLSARETVDEFNLKAMTLEAQSSGMISEQMGTVLFIYISVKDFRIKRQDGGYAIVFPANIYESKERV